MTRQTDRAWADQIASVAAHLAYPTTPDLSRRAHRPAPGRLPHGRWHRLGWATLLLIALLLSTLLLPPVRAAIQEILQIGSVRIEVPQDVQPDGRATPLSPPTTWPRLAGRTTLAGAQSQMEYPIRTPAYPPDLGEPNWVYLQDRNGPLLVLIWEEPGDPGQVRLVLYQMGPGVQAMKGEPVTLTETTVDGEPAAWMEGSHILALETGALHAQRWVDAAVLVWTGRENGQEITYRLETGLTQEEAVRIAESMQ